MNFEKKTSRDGAVRRAALALALAVSSTAAPAAASQSVPPSPSAPAPQQPQPRPTIISGPGQSPAPAGATPAGAAATTQPTVQPVRPATAQGIVYLTMTPDQISTIRTAPSVITRIALPDEAKLAICGDLYDPTTNAGSFIIDRNGNDVFIKPLPSAKNQSNLFIKTASGTVFNFDLVVVPVAQAYRVANVNLPSYQEDVEALKANARREIDAERRRMEADNINELEARRRELAQTSADALELERKKLRAEADRRAGELASARLVDGIMVGLNGVSLSEKSKKAGQVAIDLDQVAYTFEGKLYVHYNVVNNGREDFVCKPVVRVTGNGGGDESARAIESTTFTSRGEYTVPAGQSGEGVVVFERPALRRGDRLVMAIRNGESDASSMQFLLLAAE